MNRPALDALTALKDLWPLSENYEYAAELGLALAERRQAWWQRFLSDSDLDADDLPQALGYAFLVDLEGRGQDPCPDQLLGLLALMLPGVPDHLCNEISASLDCQRRDYHERDDPAPLSELSGEAVCLYWPEACAHYPIAAHLSDWTEQALAGSQLLRREAPAATVDDLCRAHQADYIDGLFRLGRRGPALLTPETPVLPGSEAALLAASGAMIAAAAATEADSAAPTLVLARPGSHHAASGRGGGSCLVNHLAVAAHAALTAEAQRVAILDLDAHHGDGSAEIFADDARVMTVSLHQAGIFFPGTGEQPSSSHNLNLAVTADDDWMAALECGLAAISGHDPDLILVEFSTDAHRADPVSDLSLADEDYAEATRLIASLAKPTVFELGASLSQRAWIGGLRGLARGWAAARS